MAASVQVLRLRRKGPRPGGGPGLRRILGWMGLGLGLGALAAYLVWEQGAVDRALRALPAEERHAQFLRTAEELRTVCADPPQPLRSHCREQAEFLVRFPECDAECRRLVERFFPPQPVR